MLAVILFRLILFLGFLLVVDILLSLSLRSYTKNKLVRRLPWLTTTLLLIFALIIVITAYNAPFDYIRSRYYFLVFGFLFVIIILKSLMILLKLVERANYLLMILVFVKFLKRKLFDKKKADKSIKNIFLTTGIIMIVVFICLFTYGMIWGKYNVKVEKHSIVVKDLPTSFTDFRIVQISDTHFGSFADTVYYSKVVEIINSQQPDIIFFTGDMVNNEAGEADDFIPLFKRLKAKYGKFAVLGNHDMGDYRRWYTESGKISDFNQVAELYSKMGFQVLSDECRYIKINNDSIAVIGVKSWSLPPFMKYGNLEKAMTGVPDSIFKILLTHNPSHWKEKIKGKTKIELTLSGHTHGMQMGIYAEYFKWSPIQYIYSYWGGVYKEEGQYLNVNKGLGVLGIPSRVGICPEITVIDLKKEGM
jgi:predicted MPP superfamily phosphohydrolase